MNKRERWIDELRGFAIILVVLGHVIGGLNFQKNNTMNLLHDMIYTFHMPLMFIVSGYVGKKYSYGDSCKKIYIESIKSLIVSLYVPYLIWGYIFWAVKYFIYAGNEAVTLKQGINLFWNYNAWNPGWFLLALFFVKIIDMFLQHMNLKYQLLVWLSLAIWGSQIQVYLLTNVFQFGIFYFVGRVVAVLYNNLWEDIKRYFHYINLTLFLLGVVCYFNNWMYWGKFFVGISVSVFLAYIFRGKKQEWRFIGMIGQYSMITYVLHAYFTIPIRVILNYFSVQNLWIYIMLEMLFSVVFLYSNIICKTL